MQADRATRSLRRHRLRDNRGFPRVVRAVLLSTLSGKPEIARMVRAGPFGMFIHWGNYSLLGDGEWVMQEHHLTTPRYEQLAVQFAPANFDAA